MVVIPADVDGLATMRPKSHLMPSQSVGGGATVAAVVGVVVVDSATVVAGWADVDGAVVAAVVAVAAVVGEVPTVVAGALVVADIPTAPGFTLTVASVESDPPQADTTALRAMRAASGRRGDISRP